MTLYERIETLRKSKNISQGKLEKELGFSNGSISKWKNSTPTTERLQKLADYFGVTVEYLLTGEEAESEVYYTNPETARMAQEMFEDPDMSCTVKSIQRMMVYERDCKYPAVKHGDRSERTACGIA